MFFAVVFFGICTFLANASSAYDLLCGNNVLIQDLAQGQTSVAQQSSVAIAATGQDSWTHGAKRLLFMRLIFPDDSAEPISTNDAVALMAEANQWYVAKSYGATSIASDITPLLLMPQSKTWYRTRSLRQFMDDARAAAVQKGYNTNDYNLDIARFNNIDGWSFSGTSIVRGKGLWLQSSLLGVVIHELGHNYGLQHANFWAAFADSIIGPGTNSEYGNVFDVMGQSPADPELYHFNVAWLAHLQWLDGQSVQTVTNSGVYRLNAFDVSNLTAGRIYALKIRKDGARDYWAEFRRSFTSNPWTQNGIILNWSPWENSRFGTQLLDTTPGSPAPNDGVDDSPLVVGRTLSDQEAGVHITPLAVSGVSTDQWIDVRVNLGFFNSNASPTLSIAADRTTVLPGEPIRFTASAADPDGDSLAFHWDFGDLTLGSNSMQIVKSWANSGEYIARCTASDMRGGLASRQILVTIGSPATFRISGRVTNEVGAPLPEVRVHNGATGPAYRGTLTDSDGNYSLVNLSSGNYSLTAVKYGYNLTSVGWLNPVAVGPNATARNWSASPYPPVSVVATDASAAESNGTPDLGVFTISRGGALQSSLTVRFNLEGSAELWDDFTLSAGVFGFPYSLVFPPGVASTNLTLTPLDDSSFEGPETIVLRLIEDVGYRVDAPATATATIADSESVPSPDLAIVPLGAGSYQIWFDGIPDLTYRIEYTESLSSTWQTLTNQTADEFGRCEIVDTPPGGSRQRFYRSVYPW
jgi:hypothetical protein